MADQMDIDLPEEHHQTPQTTIPSPEKPNQNQPQSQQSQKKQSSSSSSSSSIRELTTCTIKSPPFAYVHLSTLSSLSSSGAPITPPPANPAPAEEESQEIIDALQVRFYCTAALQRFLGDTGAAILPDILLIRSSSSSSKKGQQEADIYLRLPRQDLGAFAAAITAYPGRQVSKGSAKQDEGGWLLLQIQSCGDWLGSLIGKAEEKDIWDRD